MHCNVCQTPAAPDQSQCTACGAGLDRSACANCGKPNAFDSAYCVQCGQPLHRRGDTRHGGHAPPDARPATERKFLTVLSADICKSTRLIANLDPEDALARLAPALAVMQLAVREQGGIVSEELGDGLLALFGAPKADGNHAIRACLAGLSMQHRIRSLADAALQIRVGVHSGYAITRFKDLDLTKVYGASGAVVHMANRLQSAAKPGGILISGSCHDLANGHPLQRR